MYRPIRRVCLNLLFTGFCAFPLLAQQAFTWQQVRARFEANNPTLKAGQFGIRESRADEVTAYLRPNPTANVSIDQLNLFEGHPYRPLYDAYPNVAIDYLHERQHKRELRRESAQQATLIAVSNQSDLNRNLTFSLRDAFVRTLQAKALRDLAKENLAYYDHVLQVNRDRYQAGDIAQVDLNRLELQRVQFESDSITAEVNLRTAKVELLTLMNDRTPVDQFDVAGSFDFIDSISPLDDFHKIALDARPDLKAAVESVEKAHTDHQLSIANGSADPTFGADLGRNPPLQYYMGFSVNFPLRIFDRNQGEKARTLLDISRNEQLRQAAETSVLGDVDSAYATLMSTVALLVPYRDHYLKQASEVRDNVSFAYSKGAASLLDLLDAQREYRVTELSYLNLVGSFLSAANQLNFSVGREVIQ
jgi:cobalt-zinc-cadmium efflux system outer membrane protein